MAELSDEVLSRLGLTTIGDRHRLHVLCANAENCLWLQLLLANTWLFSADEVAVVEEVAVVGKESFLREGLGQ